jgi:hypothetical protein
LSRSKTTSETPVFSSASDARSRRRVKPSHAIKTSPGTDRDVRDRRLQRKRARNQDHQRGLEAIEDVNLFVLAVVGQALRAVRGLRRHHRSLQPASLWPSRPLCSLVDFGEGVSRLLRAKATKPAGRFCSPQLKCLLVPFLRRLAVGPDPDDAARSQLVGIVGAAQR